MEQAFIVVTTNEDGETRMERVSKSELEQRLADDYYGTRRKPTTDLPKDGDLNAQAGIWIIAGDLVAPQPVEVVKQWRL